jgi:hypothetical protein
MVRLPEESKTEGNPSPTHPPTLLPESTLPPKKRIFSTRATAAENDGTVPGVAARPRSIREGSSWVTQTPTLSPCSARCTGLLNACQRDGCTGRGKVMEVVCVCVCVCY